VTAEASARAVAHPGITYPFASPPSRGRLMQVAPGVHWIRMPLPYALDHINLWALEDDAGWTVVDTGVHTDESMAVWTELLAHWPDTPSRGPLSPGNDSTGVETGIRHAF